MCVPVPRAPGATANRRCRPEKDHPLQVRALHELLQMHPEWRSGAQKVQLVLVGGARNAADIARVDSLKALCAELGVEVRACLSLLRAAADARQENVDFFVNAEYLQLLSLLANASVGISTMVDEHFGINVVEYMVCPSPFLPLCVSSYNYIAGGGADTSGQRFGWPAPGHRRTRGRRADRCGHCHFPTALLTPPARLPRDRRGVVCARARRGAHSSP